MGSVADVKCVEAWRAETNIRREGMGSPEPDAMDRHRLKNLCYGGSPERDQTRVDPSCICRAEQDCQDAVTIHA